MNLTRLVLFSAAIFLTAAIIWAGLNAPFWASFSHITANPWGVVTLVDLYSGFLLASVLIWLIEPRKGLAAGIVLLTLVLGNIVTLLWLGLRGLMLVKSKM